MYIFAKVVSTISTLYHLFSSLLYPIMHQPVHFNPRRVQFGHCSVLNTVRNVLLKKKNKDVHRFIMQLRLEFVTNAGFFFFSLLADSKNK